MGMNKVRGENCLRIKIILESDFKDNLRVSISKRLIPNLSKSSKRGPLFGKISETLKS